MGAEPDPSHWGGGESPESIPKHRRRGRAWETGISWKQLRTDLPVMPCMSPGCWTKPQVGADGRVKGCPAAAGDLCLPACSKLPGQIPAGTQARGAQEGSCFPSPSQQAAHGEWARARPCTPIPLQTTAIPGGRGPASGHTDPNPASAPQKQRRETWRSQHAAALGLLQEPCIPPALPSRNGCLPGATREENGARWAES